MNKVLSFLKGVFTLPATWVAASVASPIFLESSPLTVLTTTLLFFILGREYGKIEFRSAELKVAKKKSKIWWLRTLSFTTLLATLAGIWFSLKFMMGSPDMMINGDKFLVLLWVGLIFFSFNLYNLFNSRYGKFKRFMGFLYCGIVIALMWFNYTKNFGSFELIFF